MKKILFLARKFKWNIFPIFSNTATKEVTIFHFFKMMNWCFLLYTVHRSKQNVCLLSYSDQRKVSLVVGSTLSKKPENNVVELLDWKKIHLYYMDWEKFLFSLLFFQKCGYFWQTLLSCTLCLKITEKVSYWIKSAYCEHNLEKN